MRRLGYLLRHRHALLALLLAATGCGSGGGGSHAPTRASGLWLEDPDRQAPGQIHFVLKNPAGDRADVALLVAAEKGGAETPIEGGRLRELATSPDGVEHSLTWDYAAQVGPGHARVTLGLRISTNPGGSTAGTYERIAVVSLGNDPPRVTGITLPGKEVAGRVSIAFTTTDSSTDPLQVRVTYETEDGTTGVATPAGAPVDNDGYLEKRFRPGEEPVFEWDAAGDLGTIETDVTLTLTARDDQLESDPLVSDRLRVDNNLEPSLFADGQTLLDNPDERDGIPVTVTVSDPEGDAVGLLFQWRRPGHAWDDAGLDDPAEIARILADPQLRRDQRICTERPRRYRGRAARLDDTEDPDHRRLRLPELGRAAAGLVAGGGLLGQHLELLRSPVPAKVLGKKEGLDQPVAILPLEGPPLRTPPFAGSPSALVLDGAWRLRRVDLAGGDGEILASGSGRADALAFEPDRRSVLVATSTGDGTRWQVDRVRLTESEPSTELLITSDGQKVETGRVRGIVALSAHSALITVGHSLIELHYTPGEAPRAVTRLADRATPWGIAVDPLHPRAVYLAERDWPNPETGLPEGRVVRVDLESHRIEPVPAASATPDPGRRPAGAPAGLPRPRALAVTHSGTRLLAITDEGGDGRLELRGIDPASGATGPYELASDLIGDQVGVATGTEDLILVALDGPDQIQAAGGIEQQRGITTYDPTTFTVTVDRPFDPPPVPGARWSIAGETGRVTADPAGTTAAFVWDSRDVPAGGEIQLRAIAFDTDTGQPLDLLAGDVKSIRRLAFGRSTVLEDPAASDPSSAVAADLDGDGDTDFVVADRTHDTLALFVQTGLGLFAASPGGPLSDPALVEPAAVAAADLDGDGDIDLVAAGGHTDSSGLTIFLQTGPGLFLPSPQGRLQDSSIDEPHDVIVADLDGDGDADLLSANYGSDNLTVFLQTEAGRFEASAQGALTSGTMRSPESVASADLDGDGDLDLVAASVDSDDLTIFLQNAPGIFDPSPQGPLTDPAMDWTASVAAADLDDDGDLDLAATSGFFPVADGKVVIFLQVGPGVFEPSPRGPLSDARMRGPTSITAADIDADGAPDLVLGTSDGPILFLQTAPGLFAAWPDNPFLDAPSREVVVADFDGNGRLDLLSPSWWYQTITLSFQNGPGLSSPALSGPLGDDRTAPPVALEAADLDADGDLDLVAAGGDSLALYRQESPGRFGAPPAALLADPAMRRPVAVVPADLDGDGDIDLASANEASDNLVLFLQDDNGNYLPSSPGPLADPRVKGPAALAAADLDGDGDLDLAVAGGQSDTLLVFIQTGAGRFQPAPQGALADEGHPADIVTADLDADGDQDIVSANTGNDTLRVFLQVGPGRFEPSPQGALSDAALEQPESLSCADLDGDGDLDLVAAGSGSAALVIFTQDGAGLFVPSAQGPLTDPSMRRPHVVRAADLDGDGDIDLLAADRSGPRFAIFRQTTPGRFAPDPTAVPPGANVTGLLALVLADLDGDGDLDLATSSGNGIRLLFGNH